MEAAATERKCHRCTHFHITHDTLLPYGCRALQFKSRQQPCLEVVAVSGEECQFFAAKAAATKRAGA